MTEPVLEQYEVDDNGPRLIVREMLTSSKAADLWLGDLVFMRAGFEPPYELPRTTTSVERNGGV